MVFISNITIFKEYDHKVFQYFSKSIKPQIELFIEPYEIYAMNIAEIISKENKYRNVRTIIGNKIWMLFDIKLFIEELKKCSYENEGLLDENIRKIEGLILH